MKKQKTHTYTAFYSDGTVKVGYCADVMERMRTLGGSSSCFVCFRATHQDEREARETEKQIKIRLAKYLIEDAECQEWLDRKRWGFFPALRRTLEGFTIKLFDYALALGQKRDTDWEKTTPADIKKIVTGKP